MEINFLSKVYSISLLKVGSLKGSVVYSLILNYQLCAFHNCKLYTRSVYMIISDTSCMIDVFTIALLTAEFGQVWAE